MRCLYVCLLLCVVGGLSPKRIVPSAVFRRRKPGGDSLVTLVPPGLGKYLTRAFLFPSLTLEFFETIAF